MRQTLALFHDAYRELNAKRMFWIVLILSGVFVLGFAAIGVNAEQEFTLFGGSTHVPSLFGPAKMYKFIFSYFGVQIWLAWIAMILAIISTAGIFPDLLTGGSIDLYLCKPISRFRLFLTKYVAGMAFVALQVFVFSLACFVVIGVRGDAWEPRIFLAVPLVVLVFSYLWCVSVLLGLLTRSTVAAMLMTLLFWLIVFGADFADQGLSAASTHHRRILQGDQPRLQAFESQAKAERLSLAATQPTAADLQHADHLDARWHAMQATYEAHLKDLAYTSKRQKWVNRLKLILPKTRETNDVLSRALLSREDLFEIDANSAPPPKERPWLQPDIVAETNDAMRTRPISWIVGTSLLFEAAILAWAARIFCRRDF